MENKRELASKEVKKIKEGLNKKMEEVEQSFKKRIMIAYAPVTPTGRYF